MEKHTYDLFNGRTLHTAFYQEVTNGASLHEALLNQEIDVALINAQLIDDTLALVQIVDPFQIHAAASRVLLCDGSSKLSTKNIHSELVFNLSGSRNVSESFRRFGVNASCKSLVLAVFDADEEILAKVAALVEGKLVPFSLLGSHLTSQDEQLIKKYYKIQDLELSASTLVDAITCRIATKSCSK